MAPPGRRRTARHCSRWRLDCHPLVRRRPTNPFTAIAVALIAYAMVVAGAMKADAWRARTPVT